MRRLLLMLAWAECRRADWFLAAGETTLGELALAAAKARLVALAGIRPRPWRPLVAARNHGLRIVRQSRR